jgi:hypothetical protein
MPDNLYIEGTLKTPTIKSDSTEGTVEIKGRSHPENPIDFYKPLSDWTSEYIKDPRLKTIINIQLEHFNTSSSKRILDLLRKFELILMTNKEVQVNWYYDDEDILEAGETFQTMTKIPFKMIEIN